MDPEALAELRRLRFENLQLREQLRSTRAQLQKAYKDRAELHSRLRQFQRSTP